MRFNLRIKIFLILLAINLVVICAMLVFMLFSFEVGFSGYVEQIEDKRIENLSRRLGKEYSHDKGFGFLIKRPELAEALEELIFLDTDAIDVEISNEIPHHEEDPGYFPLYYVLDKDRELVFGHRDDQTEGPLIPIRSETDIVGWVGVHQEEIIHEDNQAFIQDLSFDFLIIAGLITLFSALAAMTGAFYFQRPIQVLVKGTRALTSGNYTVRVPEKTTDELGDLSRDFNVLAQTLEENENAKKKWVEDISHELKTPLSLMGGELEAVRDGIRELTPQTLELLEKDIAHLTKLVNDLNELWKSESKDFSFDFVHVDMMEILNRAAENFTTGFSALQINISLPKSNRGEIMINGDAERLSQVFDNLFQNSLRYTDPGGLIKVDVKKEGSVACIRLEDSSPGVPSGEFEKIFQRLYRVEPSRNRSLGGAGIGLAICKHIIKAHKGSIRSYPSPLGGLGIQIQLPLVKEWQS